MAFIDKKGREKPMKKLKEDWLVEDGLPELGMWKFRYNGDGYFTKKGKLQDEVMKAVGYERIPEEVWDSNLELKIDYLGQAALRAVARELREWDKEKLRYAVRGFRGNVGIPVRYPGMSAK